MANNALLQMIAAGNAYDPVGGFNSGLQMASSRNKDNQLMQIRDATLAQQRAQFEMQQQLYRYKQDALGQLAGVNPNAAMYAAAGITPPTYGTSIHYDDQGNAYQASSSGGLTPVAPMGPGGQPVRMVRPATMQDLGSRIQGIDPITGMPRGAPYQVDLAPEQQPETKGAVTAAQDEAKLAVERRATLPKVKAAHDKIQADANVVLEQVERAKSLLGPMTTGWGAALEYLPATDARKLANILDTIKNRIAFNELSTMRQNSPTGGAVGQLTDAERTALGNLMGSLDNYQSGDDIREVLDQISTLTKKLSSSAADAFYATYPDAAVEPRASTQQPTPTQSQGGAREVELNGVRYRMMPDGTVIKIGGAQ